MTNTIEVKWEDESRSECSWDHEIGTERIVEYLKEKMIERPSRGKPKVVYSTYIIETRIHIPNLN